MSDTTIASVVDPSLTASLHPVPDGHKSKADDGGPDGYPTGVQIAIAASVIVGIVIIAALLLRVYRLRTRRRSSRMSRLGRLGPSHDDTTQDAITSLPRVDSVLHPVEPPPRLKERRLLTGRVPDGVHRSSSKPAHFSRFPANPICSPIRAKLIPRREEVVKPFKTHASAPLLSSLRIREDASTKSGTSSHTAGSSVCSSASLARSHHRLCPPSTNQSRRLRSLASPGPAPDKELPPTPTSRTRGRPAPLKEHGILGVAAGIVNVNPADGVVLGPHSRDLCELTEGCLRETRNSGGSWSGNGGGGPGVALPSPRKNPVEKPPRSVLEEGELQRMGGGY